MAKRQQLWCEAAKIGTLLDSILVQNSAQKSQFYSVFGVDAKYTWHLQVPGEMCFVADTNNIVVTEVCHFSHF